MFFDFFCYLFFRFVGCLGIFSEYVFSVFRGGYVDVIYSLCVVLYCVFYVFFIGGCSWFGLIFSYFI